MFPVPSSQPSRSSRPQLKTAWDPENVEGHVFVCSVARNPYMSTVIGSAARGRIPLPAHTVDTLMNPGCSRWGRDRSRLNCWWIGMTGSFLEYLQLIPVPINRHGLIIKALSCEWAVTWKSAANDCEIEGMKHNSLVLSQRTFVPTHPRPFLTSLGLYKKCKHSMYNIHCSCTIHVLRYLLPEAEAEYL